MKLYICTSVELHNILSTPAFQITAQNDKPISDMKENYHFFLIIVSQFISFQIFSPTSWYSLWLAKNNIITLLPGSLWTPILSLILLAICTIFDYWVLKQFVVGSVVIERLIFWPIFFMSLIIHVYVCLWYILLHVAFSFNL